MRPIRVALCGIGRMGKLWARALDNSRDFELVGVVDVATSRWPSVLAVDEPFDAAIVATPTDTHRAIVTELSALGKHILCEKPLAPTAADCAALAELPGLVVGHVERFNPAVSALASILKRGTIGEPVHFDIARVGGYPEHVSPGNNVVLDLAIHDIDLLRKMLGALKVRARIEHGDHTAEILLESEHGASALVHVNWTTPIKIRTWRVTGTRGVASADLVAQTVTVASGNAQQSVPVEKAQPLERQLAAFAHLIRTGDRGSLCSCVDAAMAVQLAER